MEVRSDTENLGTRACGCGEDMAIGAERGRSPLRHTEKDSNLVRHAHVSSRRYDGFVTSYPFRVRRPQLDVKTAVSCFTRRLVDAITGRAFVDGATCCGPALGFDGDMPVVANTEDERLYARRTGGREYGEHKDRAKAACYVPGHSHVSR